MGDMIVRMEGRGFSWLPIANSSPQTHISKLLGVYKSNTPTILIDNRYIAFDFPDIIPLLAKQFITTIPILESWKMQHATLEHEGAWTFGQSQRTEWYILKNKDIPGPGTHPDPKSRTATSWTMSKDPRSTFQSFMAMEKGVPVGTYDPDIDPTRADPTYISFQNSCRKQLPESITKDTNYNPQFSKTKYSAPLYSLGYSEPMMYDTEVPSPDTYNNSIPSRSASFNKTQNYFTSADRPTPYGEEAKFPGVGSYHIEETKKSGPYIKIGKGDRPGQELCPDSPLIFYQLKSTIGKEGKGFSLSDKLWPSASKEDTPGPSQYYPNKPGRKTKIFTPASKRSEMTCREILQKPSPGAYQISKSLDRGVGFSKAQKELQKIHIVPGSGTYEVSSALGNTHGKIGLKLKKLKEFITPSAQDYHPNASLTERRPVQSIVYYSNRTDFSKSVTRHVGPGDYELRTRLNKQLGKMGRSLRPGVRSETPGPGQYQLPTTIGRIPKYYKNLNRKITEHGETKIIKYDPEKTSKIMLRQPDESKPVKENSPAKQD